MDAHSERPEEVSARQMLTGHTFWAQRLVKLEPGNIEKRQVILDLMAAQVRSDPVQVPEGYLASIAD